MEKLICAGPCKEDLTAGGNRTLWAELSRTDGKFYARYIPQGHKTGGFHPFCPMDYIKKFYPQLSSSISSLL